MQKMIPIEEDIEMLKAMMDEPEMNEIQTGSAVRRIREDMTKAMEVKSR